MTLQNVRSLLWRGEDLGYGGGNTREVVFSTKVQATARPLIVTQGFVSSQVITGYLGTSAVVSYNGLLRLVMNRSCDYWMTLTAQCTPANGAAVQTIQMPIAPLSSLFLPGNIYGPATLTMNSTWPIPVPLAGAPTSAAPLANTTNTLTFDVLAES